MKALAVVNAAHITYRQLDYWTRSGYLHPTNDRCGSGSERDYPDTEVQVAERMGALVAAGFNLATAHSLARNDPAAVARLEQALSVMAET